MPCISRIFLKVYPKYIGGLSMRFHTAHSPETGTVPRTVIRWALPVHWEVTEARRARLEAPDAWLTTSKYSEGGSSSTTARPPGAEARRYTPTALAFRLRAPVGAV